MQLCRIADLKGGKLQKLKDIIVNQKNYVFQLSKYNFKTKIKNI